MLTLERLLRADIFRDGGSIDVDFTTQEGMPFSLSLRVSPSSPGEYVTLRESAIPGYEAPNPLPPVLTGSGRELEILDALQRWLDRHADDPERGQPDDVLLVRRMLREIPRRRESPPTWPILPLSTR